MALLGPKPAENRRLAWRLAEWISSQERVDELCKKHGTSRRYRVTSERRLKGSER